MSAVDAKKLARCIKEGGKRGVEIDGAATMGGLSFFCTKVRAGCLELALHGPHANRIVGDPGR